MFVRRFETLCLLLISDRQLGPVSRGGRFARREVQAIRVARISDEESKVGAWVVDPVLNQRSPRGIERDSDKRAGRTSDCAQHRGATVVGAKGSGSLPTVAGGEDVPGRLTLHPVPLQLIELVGVATRVHNSQDDAGRRDRLPSRNAGGIPFEQDRLIHTAAVVAIHFQGCPRTKVAGRATLLDHGVNVPGIAGIRQDPILERSCRRSASGGSNRRDRGIGARCRRGHGRIRWSTGRGGVRGHGRVGPRARRDWGVGRATTARDDGEAVARETSGGHLRGHPGFI